MTYSFQASVDKVMTCTSGARTGTFTVSAGIGPPFGGSWEVTDATGDFVGLSGSGAYYGRDIYLDETNFSNPIYVFVQESEYSDTNTGTIEFDLSPTPGLGQPP